MSRQILALEKDLFFSVKMRDTLRHHDITVIVARNLQAFERHLETTEGEKPELAIVNIALEGVDWETAIRAARTHKMPVLAFGSHMDLEARAKALAAGAQRVVANSKFTSDMPGLIQRMLNGPVTIEAEEAEG